MHRIVSSLAIIIFLGVLISCSGTSKTAQSSDTQKMKAQKYPSWYPSQKIVSSKSALSAYATAIDTDSASSVKKAVAWATSELKSSVSSKLERIRSEAVVEYGSESGLDSPRFLIALRKAKRAVEPLAETGQTEIKSVEGFNSVRSFAEVSVPKDQLIERIGKRLAGHEKAWNTLIKSKAFQNF